MEASMTTSKNITRRVILLLGALFVFAATPVLADKTTYQSGGVAINGYDPVAYFVDNAPIKGDTALGYTWNGTKWQFANQKNLAAFKENPEKFAPKFGGYCAYAVSQGYTALTDPNAWSIVDGSLYLNYSKSVRSRWQQDTSGNIVKGDANWPGLRADLIK